MGLEECKHVVAMVVVQSIYAVLALLAKASFRGGMSPMVFVVYRQAIAVLVLTPTTIFSRGCAIHQLAPGWKGFLLIFGASFIGITLNQYCYYEGLNFATSPIATAMNNLVPAITFVMAAAVGLEKVTLRSSRGMAKILGTIICIGGAICMAFFKGPELLSMEFRVLPSSILLGCLFLMGSSSCWSMWNILQVPICRRYLDPLSSSVWMCFLGTLQSAILTILLTPDLDAWKITSYVELLACLFAGTFGSGVTFYLQAWCISARGPLFPVLFTPLCTIITTILSAVILHEVLHIGSLVGALVAIVGLYTVLWGKAKEQDTKSRVLTSSTTNDAVNTPFSTIVRWISYEPDTTTEPLLTERRDQDILVANLFIR